MAKKALESNTKRKAEDEAKKDEVTKKKTKTESTNSNKNLKTSKNPEDSSKKTDDSKKKTKEVKKPDKKVKIESPVKRSGKKDDVEVKKSKKNGVKKEEVVDENESSALYAFPMNRVTRIIKSENSDVKLAAEAAFLINKASEKFLELFSKEAYACASQGGKKKIEYQHLSSLIPGNRRLDFLSDFVPAKVKVADALKEIPSVET